MELPSSPGAACERSDVHHSREGHVRKGGEEDSVLARGRGRETQHDVTFEAGADDGGYGRLWVQADEDLFIYSVD
jgi:hypothetical protein